MNNQGSVAPGLKQKAIEEFRELLGLSLYLAFFFCALATYSMLLLSEFHVRYWNYGFALINALVVAKVIMIGEYAKVGTRFESRPLLLSAVWKAFIYSLLVVFFHVLEEGIKDGFHPESISGALHHMQGAELLGHTLVVFCTFIPLFGFREFRRVLGREKFRAMLFSSRSV